MSKRQREERKLEVPPFKGPPRSRAVEEELEEDLEEELEEDPEEELAWEAEEDPSWDPEAPAAPPSTSFARGGRAERLFEKRARRSRQAPRLKVTVQRPDLLDALALRLGLNKAAVVNFALSKLAEQEGLLD